MEDRREDYGEFYPGGGAETGHGSGGGSAPEMSSKVDRVTIKDPGDDPSLFDLRDTVRRIVRAMAPAVTMLIVMAAFGQKAQLGYLKGSTFVVTNETDAAAMAEITSATNAMRRASIEMGETLRGEIASATNAVYDVIPNVGGIATAEQLVSATNAIYRSLADIQTSISASNSAFRLSLPDGSTYLDATGTVWNVHHDTFLSQWYVTSYNFNTTNEIPGISSWSITYDSAPGTWSLRIPSGGVEVASYMGSEADDYVSFMLPAEGVDIPVEFARTNVYSTYYTAEDRVRFMSDPISDGALIPDDFTTTNAVKDIVTQDVIEYTEWTHGNVWKMDDDDGLHGSLTNFGVAYIDGVWNMKISGSYSYDGVSKIEFHDEFVPCDNFDPDALEVAFTWDGVYLPATRSKVAYNSLGLARLKDIRDLPTHQGVTNIVRDLSLGGIWDEEMQVWWTPRMRNGSLTYEATTNVNLNAEN